MGATASVDVEGTERLLDAAHGAGVSRVVYPSIVGVTQIPLSYYEHKRTAETVVAESPVSSVIVRSTQFYSFLGTLFESLSKLSVWPIPSRVSLQPIAAATLADTIGGLATDNSCDRTVTVGGPTISTISELAATFKDHRGLRRPIIPVPALGATLRGFRAGHATCPDHAAGTVTWKHWLNNQYPEDE